MDQDKNNLSLIENCLGFKITETLTTSLLHKPYGLLCRTQSASRISKALFPIRYLLTYFLLRMQKKVVKRIYAIYPDAKTPTYIYQIKTTAQNYSENYVLPLPTSNFKKRLSSSYRHMIGIHFSINCIVFEVE